MTDKNSSNLVMKSYCGESGERSLQKIAKNIFLLYSFTFFQADGFSN